MNTITKEEYIKALDIVIQFNKQINLITTIDFDSLQVGNTIVFTQSASKYVTIEKEYVVLDSIKEYNSNEIKWFGFIADNGKKKYLRKYSRGYEVKIIK